VFGFGSQGLLQEALDFLDPDEFRDIVFFSFFSIVK
jgi:hypothetical protein